MNSIDEPPAAKLEGLNLDGGWRVKERLTMPYNGTGGNFGFSYLVENQNGEIAHLKALDFSRALLSPDPARALQDLTEGFNHERDLLEACKLQRLSKVVRLIEDGSVTVQGLNGPQVVQYLISENAPRGDIRRFIGDPSLQSDDWCLTCLRDVATGIQQLHKQGIAHQDVKPSNILVFEDYISKLGDLGRASRLGKSAPHDGLTIAADQSYAPPEQVYGQVYSDFEKRRKGTDAYHLGSLISFLFLGVTAKAMLFKDIDPSYYPANWAGEFDDILPTLREAFARNVNELARSLPSQVSHDVSVAFQYLCHPDPGQRGHPAEISAIGSNFEMRRFISIFDRSRRSLLHSK